MQIGLDRRVFLLGATAVLSAPAAAKGLEFTLFVEQLKPQATAAGIDAAFFDAAVKGLAVDTAVIGQSEKQSEFTRPFWDYVEGAVSPARIRQGLAALRTARGSLARVSGTLAVERQVIAGIWGMESNFGASMGNKDVLRSTGSLAFAGYRGDFYAKEFIAALRILQEGHIARKGLLGSWAGAMGQTQFIPSSFLAYAYDLDGDGRKNIWTSSADALASAANHLKLDGWISGLPWGFEVVLPAGFDWTYGDRMQRHDFSVLSGTGLRRPGDAAFPASGTGGLFLPVGANGPAFVITGNFEVIRKYNTSDAYALGVGLLGDRLFGAPALAGKWPKNEPQLGTRQLADLQQRLKSLGLPVSKIDGKLGWQTRQAVQAVQRRLGLTPDGHPGPALLQAASRL
jgi:membrane-bound lytic murein transglycosylase B